MFKFYRSIPIFILLSCYTSYAHAVLDAIIVSATRTEQSALTTPASITVISRDEIEASGARHVIDVLHGRGGVQIFDSFGDGGRSSIGMRGFGETANANTLILVDGRRLNNSDIAPPDLNNIALEDVERVEIVQGSAGVLFGDQAVGGVVNIITRRQEVQRSTLQVSAGSYNTVDFHGMTSRTFDNGINYRVSLDLRESDNFRQNNEASYLNGFGKLGYDYDSGSVYGELQYIDDELNAPGTLFDNEVKADRRQVSPNFANDFSDAETIVERLGVVQELGNNWSFEGELTNRDTEGVFRLSSVFGAETQNSTQDREILEFTPRLIGFIPVLNDTQLTLGADVIESDYELSSRFGVQMNDQSQTSVYAQAVIPATPELDVTLGVRYAEVENELTDGFTFSNEKIEDDVTVGTFGVAYQLSSDWRFLARVDQNYRFAKVDEYTNAQPFPAPPSTAILETQEGRSTEAGIEWSGTRSHAKLLIYQLDLDKELAFDPVNFININLSETQRNGLITEGRWQLNDKLGITISYTFADAEITSGAFEGKEIPLVAEHSGFISGDYRINSHWQIYGEIQAIGDRVFSGDFNNVLDNLPGYGVINCKAEYSSKDFVLSGRINNLLNKEYTEVGVLGTDPIAFTSREAFFPSPELNILITAGWKFR